MHPISSRDENDSLSSTEDESQLPQAPQEEPSLRNRYVRGTLCYLPQVEWTPRCRDSKEGRVSLQWLNAGSYFISQDEGLSESPVETLEKAVVSTSSGQRASHAFESSRGALSSMLPKVTMPDTS